MSSDLGPLRSERGESAPLISVVIPTYNRANLIVDALESVKAQTYRPLEIIIVDDGSEDETHAVVDRWCVSENGGRQSAVSGQPSLRMATVPKETNNQHSTTAFPPSTTCGELSRTINDQLSIKFVRQNNLGGNVARNHGIREATGEFVAFLDSDDKWHADKLEKQVAILDRGRRRTEDGGQRSEVAPKDGSLSTSNHQPTTTVGAVYCGLQCWFPEEDNRIEEPAPREYPSGNILNEMLIHDVTSPTSCYLIRKTVFDDVGVFDETLQARQDWDMWIRVAAEYAIAAVPEVLVDYREHSGVRTASNPQKEIKAYRAIMKKYDVLRSACPFKVRQAAKASFYRRMGRVHFHQKISIPKAFGYQLLSVLCWPFTFDSYAALFGMLLPRDGRQALHRVWNKVFGSTALAIKSH